MTTAIVVVSLDELRATITTVVCAVLDARTPAPTQSTRVALDELARLEGCSRATIRRLVAEGGPVHYLGASPRFDLDEWRAWCDARGRHGTTAAPSKTTSIVGVRLLSRAGGR